MFSLFLPSLCRDKTKTRLSPCLLFKNYGLFKKVQDSTSGPPKWSWRTFPIKFGQLNLTTAVELSMASTLSMWIVSSKKTFFKVSEIWSSVSPSIGGTTDEELWMSNSRIRVIISISVFLVWLVLTLDFSINSKSSNEGKLQRNSSDFTNAQRYDITIIQCKEHVPIGRPNPCSSFPFCISS